MRETAIEQLRSPGQKKLLHADLPAPLYYQIFTILRDHVLSGEIPVGTQLPTEFELAEYFGVSRITAKRAMDDLAAAGLVERRRGRGTHVIHHVTPKPLRGPLTGLLENVEILTEATDVYLRQFSREAPPKPIRTLFKLDADETLVRAIRIRSRAGTPFGYYTSWTRTDHAEFNEANLATTSRLVLFKRCRIGVAHVDQFLSAVSANALSAMHLKVKPGTALLTAERHSFNAAGDLVDLLNIQYRPDQFRYKMSMNVKNWKSKE